MNDTPLVGDEGERAGPMRLELPSEKYIESFFEAMAEFEA